MVKIFLNGCCGRMGKAIANLCYNNPDYTDEEEIKELLVNRKWYYSLFAGIKALYVTASHSMANRITQLAERYENTLPQLEQEVADYEAKVRAHLERMGFQW